MKQQHTSHGQYLRLDARVGGWKAPAVAVCASAKCAVAMADSLTATINPRGVSGGFPKEGNP
jgi:hypothetical protein